MEIPCVYEPLSSGVPAAKRFKLAISQGTTQLTQDERVESLTGRQRPKGSIKGKAKRRDFRHAMNNPTRKIMTTKAPEAETDSG